MIAMPCLESLGWQRFASSCLVIVFFLPIYTSFTFADGVRPNIVFIMADDLGWGDVGFHGGNVATPSLNRLASEGLELTSHYVAPVCSPTRTGLMTGRCWSRFNVTNPQSERALPWNTITLPRALKEVGYQTCIVGKWHLGSLPEEGPNEFGFDHSYGSLGGGVSPYSHRYKQGLFTKTWHRNQVRIEEQGHVTDLITKEAIEWIQSRGPSPFFLYVPFTAVHLPIKEPQEWLNRVPVSIQGDVARHYAACVMHLDDSISKILVALDGKGVRNNTLVVFTSDNGGSTAENNDPKYPNDDCPTGKLTGNNAPWRGQKGDLYDGGTRVATIVQWPGQAKPGKVNTPVQIIDWMPTFCSIAGYKASTDLKWDGRDLSNLLSTHEPLADRSLYAVAPGWRSRSLLSGSWKLIVHGTGESERYELFHLDRDPEESNNLAGSEKEKLKEMLEGLNSMAVGDKESVARKEEQIQNRLK